MKYFGFKFLSFVIIFLIIFSNFSIVNAIEDDDSDLYPLVDKIDDFLNCDFEDLKMKLIMRLGKFPSVSACIIKNDSIVWYEGYGKAKLFPRKEPTPDTIYPVGSISKTVTATAIMQLYEKGYFDLDDDINDYIDFDVRNPKFPDNPITFRMLLSHHSSLSGDHNLNYYYLTVLFFLHKNDYPFPLIKQLLTPNGKYYRDEIWRDFPPGTIKSYSNFNFIVLEHIIEKLTGKKFNDYCKEYIFEPLKMYNTSFYFEDLKNKELAGAYHNIGSIYFPIPYVETGYSYGSLKTSINDLSHYIFAYINEGEYDGYRLFEESTIEEMLEVQYNTDQNYSRYCLGWQYFPGFGGSSTFGHTGHTLGGTGAVFMNTTQNYALIFFINRYISFKGPFSLISWFMIMQYLNDLMQDY